ncbi:hypothetical protein YDYSG_56930 [Paenibacillus tyrfis]|uniref:hypothetical protein n=1 Tax=Paenibacillus tyrfis TaxID=1501230 RepID=UPI002491F46B|nr:hypothetical protein [Paenibacillus tyrfis]GLI09661.1 hypothetical protein YDYSG_56930 [Paenibacillus tyrfis]
MNQSELAHKAFLELVKNFDIEHAKIGSTNTRNSLKYLLENNLVDNKKQKLYLRWLLKMSGKEFYLFQRADGVFMLLNQDLKSAATCRYCTSIKKATKSILKNYNELIEIVDLHSIEKGHGSKIMDEFITLSREIELPLSLYSETKQLVEYYQQFDFVNYGKHGVNKEFLMLRIPV